MYQWIITLLILTLISIVTSCSPPHTNPFDPENPDYDPPALTLDIPEDQFAGSDTLAGDSLVVYAGANADDVEFRLWLTGRDAGPWGADSRQVVHFLDDGWHVLNVYTRYSGGNDIDSAGVSFFVNQLPAVALFAFPYLGRRNGDTLRFELRGRGLPKAVLVHCSFDTGTIVSAECGFAAQDPNVNILAYGETIDCTVLPQGTMVQGDIVVASVVLTGFGSRETVGIRECRLVDEYNQLVTEPFTRGVQVPVHGGGGQ